jgi:LysM repeat protein
MKKGFTFLFMLLALMLAFGQQTPIKKSKVKQVVNGKRYIVHVVEHGQTLYSITRAYGVKSYEAYLKKDKNKLNIGDTVWIPMANGDESIPSNSSYKYVEVKQGQTLYSISKTFGVSIAELEKLNPELKSSPLRVGMILKIPLKGGEKKSR